MLELDQYSSAFMIKKIAILTSGGDAPGMNAILNTVVRSATISGIDTYLVKGGFKGLVEGRFVLASPEVTTLHAKNSGTFIFSERFPEFKDKAVRQFAAKQLQKFEIEALIVVGGDGSYKGAQALHEMGIRTIALPATIDNDITSSEFSIGFDTALTTISNAIEAISATASSHRRCILVEVMGRGQDDLAIFAAMATGSEIVITHTAPLTVEELSEKVKTLMQKSTYNKVVVIISEFVFPSIEKLAQEIEKNTGIVSRHVVLGHTQRGGVPTPLERVRAFLFGQKSVELLVAGYSGFALGLQGNTVKMLPILEALAQKRVKTSEFALLLNRINQA